VCSLNENGSPTVVSASKIIVCSALDGRDALEEGLYFFKNELCSSSLIKQACLL
jgi:hypothetical protein